MQIIKRLKKELRVLWITIMLTSSIIGMGCGQQQAELASSYSPNSALQYFVLKDTEVQTADGPKTLECDYVLVPKQVYLELIEGTP